MSSSVNIGVYNSALPGSSTYDASLASAESILGVTANVVNNGIDYGQPIGTWAAQFASPAYHTANSPGGTSNIPDLSLPMMDTSGSLTMIQAMNQIASGADDSAWAGIVNDYKAQGFKTIYIRPGWEMNGNWFPWGVHNEAEAQAYVAAFDRIATVCHSIAGINVQMVWCPDTIDDAHIPTADMYPGDSSVDVVATDDYDGLYPTSLHDWSTGKTDATLQQWWSNPVNLEHYWEYPDGSTAHPHGTSLTWSLPLTEAFAVAHHKPVALPETGHLENGKITAPMPDPDFPAYLARVLLAQGAAPISFVSIWDKIDTSSNFSDSNNPVMAAAWADFVKKIEQNDGGPSVVQPATITVANNAVIDLMPLLNALITPGRPGDTETITSASVVAGSVILGSKGQVFYTAGAAGTDTITYTITDQLGDTYNATTTIAIDGGPTINTAPLKVAHSATYSLATLGASLVTPGLNGDTETFSNVTSSSGIVTKGAAGYTYTAPRGGTDTLSYTVTDQAGDSVSGSSTLLVDPGPTLAAGGGRGATPGQALNLNYYITSLITPGLTGDTETVTAVTASTGTVTLGAGTINYTAPSSGRSILTFTVRDQLGDTATGTYSVTVNPSTIDGSVTRFGGPGDGVNGSGDAGVVVTLLTAAGSVVATQTTASNGWYAFTLVQAGSYKLSYAAPPSQVVMPGSTTTSSVFSVAANTTINELPVHFTVMSSLAGQVLYGASGQAGVTVKLLNASGQVLQTTTTGTSGNFAFYDLNLGTYQVQYAAPPGELFQTGGAVSSGGRSALITLAAGQATSLPAAVLVPGLSTIAGSILYAGGGDAGVTISLFDSSGSLLTTTTSASDGSFSFANLAYGSYQVSYATPPGLLLQLGGPANISTGRTALITVTPGQTTTLAPERLVSTPANIWSVVQHLGGATDPVWGTGVASVTVSLLDMSGSVLATTVTNSNGWYMFHQLGAGTYSVSVAAPAGNEIKPGMSAISAPITVATGDSVNAPYFYLVSAFAMNGSGLSVTQGDGAYIVTGNASNSTLVLGNGNQQVTLTGGADTVTTGNGNQIISLAGARNSVTVGTGNSTINAGGGACVVHAAGGNVSITMGGASNLFDAGTARGFLYADGSAGNVFMLNAGLLTITGFNVGAGDVLDLKQTLAGTAILPDLSNIASFVTATYYGGNTTLATIPTNGGSAQSIAVLVGVNTTVAALQAAHDFSLT